MNFYNQHSISAEKRDNRFRLLLVMLLCSFGLACCSHNPVNKFRPQLTWKELLLKQGGSLQRHAGRVQIIIPGRIVFAQNSASLINNNDVLLNEIAGYLGSDSKSNIYVSSCYSSFKLSKTDGVLLHKLAVKRAEVISQYFNNHGADSRLVVDQACVNRKSYAGDIVINFRFLDKEIM